MKSYCIARAYSQSYLVKLTMPFAKYISLLLVVAFAASLSDAAEAGVKDCRRACFITQRYWSMNTLVCPQKGSAPRSVRVLGVVNCSFDSYRNQVTFYIPTLRLVAAHGRKSPVIDHVEGNVADLVNEEFLRTKSRPMTIAFVLKVKRLKSDFFRKLKPSPYLRLKLPLCSVKNIDRSAFMDHGLARVSIVDFEHQCRCREAQYGTKLWSGDCIAKINCQCRSQHCKPPQVWYRVNAKIAHRLRRRFQCSPRRTTPFPSSTHPTARPTVPEFMQIWKELARQHNKLKNAFERIWSGLLKPF